MQQTESYGVDWPICRWEQRWLHGCTVQGKQIMLTEPIAVTLLVVEALEALDVPYFIGGSLASAVYGVVRATMGVDLVADLRMDHVKSFVSMLGDAFYVDAGVMCDAIRGRSSFNMVHLESMFKVDVFIHRARSFDKAQFGRRVPHSLVEEPRRLAYFASVEDTVLAELEWYRLGGEVSDRQWGDVQSVLKVQGEVLDRQYLRRWAAELGVSDLLERALGEAGEAGAS